MKTKSYFNITPITFKLKCLMDIEAAITLPKKGFFIRNASSMRLCYSIDNKIKYIQLPSREEAAKFLNKNGIIDSYAFINNEVHMYCKTLITIHGDKGQPVQMERMIPVKWEDIVLNDCQVLSFCAVRELELTPKDIGGRVIHMITDFLKPI